MKTSEAPPRPKLLKDTRAAEAKAEAKAAAEEKTMELVKEKEKEMGRCWVDEVVVLPTDSLVAQTLYAKPPGEQYDLWVFKTSSSS